MCTFLWPLAYLSIQQAVPYFLSHRMVLVSAWSQLFLQGPLVPFSRGWNLETRFWVFEFSLCTGVLLFLGPFSSQTHTRARAHTHRHRHRHTHTHSCNHFCSYLCTFIIDHLFRDFPGVPVVKTPCHQCRACRFDPWSGTKTLCALWCSQKSEKKKKNNNPKPTICADYMLQFWMSLFLSFSLSSDSEKSGSPYRQYSTRIA